MLAHEYVAPADPPRAWCIVLHGLGDSREGWRFACQEFAAPGLGFVLVDAPDPYFGGWSWFPLPGITSPDDDEGAHRRGLARSRQALAELIAEVQRARGIGPDRLLLMGFSQGCLMVLDAALRADRPFAGTVGISGMVGAIEEYPGALGSAARQQPILWTHGTADPLLPIERTRRACEHLRSFGVDADWREYPKEHGLDPLREVPEIRAWIADRVDDAVVG